MPAPLNIINIPRDQQIQRTVVLLHQNLVNIHVFDAATKQSIKIDNREYITLTPSRSKPTTLRVYHVPSEGKLDAIYLPPPRGYVFICICMCVCLPLSRHDNLKISNVLIRTFSGLIDRLLLKHKLDTFWLNLGVKLPNVCVAI